MTSRSVPGTRWRPGAAASVALSAAATLAGPAAAAPIFTPVAPLTSAGHVAAGGNVVAVTQVTGTTAALLVGRGATLPAQAPGVGALPSWAIPHVGTDAQGQRVVIYPRCSGAAVTSCDLYAYDVATSKETELAGANRSSTGETEGAMDRGALAFNRWRLTTQPSDVWADEPTTLLFKPAGKAARVVSKTKGGRQLALRGREIGQVRDRNPKARECGEPTVELLTTSGARRALRSYGCGMDVHLPRGLAFVGSRILWMVRSGGAPAFVRYDPKTKQVTVDRFKDGAALLSYAPLTSTTGLTIWETAVTGSPDGWELRKVSGLTYPRPD